MESSLQFKPGDLVKARGREWVVLPELRPDLLKLRPLGGAEDDATLICLPLEPEPPTQATFGLPNSDRPGSQESALLLWDALRLKLRAGAGPFRSFGNLNVEPRAYQLLPLLMALKLDPVRLLIADDVGIGKTIEAGLIARELIDRGEIERFTVVCPPHLCEQWQKELAEKFSINAEVVRTGTAARLERGLRPDESIFEVYSSTIVSLDYIKSDRRRDDFLRACPEFVIVDEAHACVKSNTATRHQRYQLLKGLAESEPRRGMVFLTATPHSGDDTAFHNLLGLLEPKFVQLAEMRDGDQRRSLRSELADHLVQRRRGDIDEWNDEAGFPDRESREATYRLTGKWGDLFNAVFAYARSMVKSAEGGTELQQRMSWWAALALLRCLSSSPAAAHAALWTRLRATEGGNEKSQIAELDRIAGDTVLDETEDDSLTTVENTPAGTLESPDDAEHLRALIDNALDLQGPDSDPKLRTMISEVRRLIKDGFRPVVFCRYIATADYLGKWLRENLTKKVHVEVITGVLSSEQREERVEALDDLDSFVTPVLVATDCLSEGVNLQRHFNAVVHYDLTWNPTRHEQREGRADRFGQPSRIVRALMLYGEDNPVDGAVLRVILRKAELIRKELGVAVPLPADNNRIVESIMKSVLVHDGNTLVSPTALDLRDEEEQVDSAWRKVTEGKISNTIFAQRRLRPDDVLPEWRKSVSVLGGQKDVERFIKSAAQHFEAPVEQCNGYCLLPTAHLPKPLQDHLASVGFQEKDRIAFKSPAPPRTEFVHRTHPLVAALADFIAEQALELDVDKPEGAARSSAMFTNGVRSRTTLYLLRLRSQLQVEKRGTDGGFELQRSLLAEECLGVAIEGDNAPRRISEAEALSLLSLPPTRNMEVGQKSSLIRQALGRIPSLENSFNHIAEDRARELLADHRRIREASAARGIRYDVIPALPVDKIGVYVFLPFARLG